MKSRPLKVGEYRKVKTWEQLLATEGAELNKGGDIYFEEEEITFLSKPMGGVCNKVVEIKSRLYTDRFFTNEFGAYSFIADFFTNDYYDENGNEIIQDEGEDQKSLRRILLNNKSMQKAMNLASEYGFNSEIEPPREQIKMVTLEVSGENIESPNLTYHWVDDINPLDQLELEANLTLTKIAKLREIETKQAEIDAKIEEQNKRIEEYERD